MKVNFQLLGHVYCKDYTHTVEILGFTSTDCQPYPELAI